MRSDMTTLEVPVDKDVYDKALEVVKEWDFDSLETPLRMFMKKLVEGKIKIRFVEVE